MKRWRVFTGCVYTGTYSLVSALTAPIQIEAGVHGLQIRQKRDVSPVNQNCPQKTTAGT